MKRPLRTLASLASLSTLLVSQPLFLPEPASSQTFVGNSCPPGTTRRGANIVRNGTFSTFPAPLEVTPVTGELVANNQAQFTSDLPYRGDGIYPDDGGANGVNNRFGGLSVQTGSINYAGGVVIGQPFPGDPLNDVPPSQTYLYSNPNQNTAGAGNPFPNPIVWQQTVAGLAPNTTYNFFAYFYDLLAANLVPGAATPQILLRLSPGVAGDPATPTPVAPTPAQRQQWRPIQYTFTTGPAQTTANLQLIDTANNINGDDFGVTAIGLQECAPNIGVAKSAGTPVANADGTFTIPYTVHVRNLAPVPLSTQPQTTYDLRNVQLTDPLTDLAAKATINSITNIQSTTLAVNTGYSGSGNPNLLLGTDTLTPQTTAVVTFNVILTPGSGPEGFGPFNNIVRTTATTQGGSSVSDDSNDGVDPDPSGAGTGTGSVPTVVRLTGQSGQANLLLVKRITNVLRNGSTLSGVNFGGFVDDPSTTEDNNPGWTQLLSTGSPVGIPALDVSKPVVPGDEVEYTVYFLSNGSTAALATNLCDLIPSGTSLVSSTTQVQSGTAPASSNGTVFTPLAPLPPNNSCSDQSNPNGAVIFSLSDLPNTPAGNVGFVRFRVRIN